MKRSKKSVNCTNKVGVTGRTSLPIMESVIPQSVMRRVAKPGNTSSEQHAHHAFAARALSGALALDFLRREILRQDAARHREVVHTRTLRGGQHSGFSGCLRAVVDSVERRIGEHEGTRSIDAAVVSTR